MSKKEYTITLDSYRLDCLREISKCIEKQIEDGDLLCEAARSQYPKLVDRLKKNNIRNYTHIFAEMVDSAVPCKDKS